MNRDFRTKNRWNWKTFNNLPVGFSDSFKFVLLFDGKTVAASFGGIHELVSQALGNGFDVSESGVFGSSCDQPDGLVDSSHWGNVASLSSCGTSRPIRVESSRGPPFMM